MVTKEEINWFSKADFNVYAGKYVAIIEKKVVSFGDNAKKVWDEAKKKFPDKTPTLAKIPKEELLVLG